MENRHISLKCGLLLSLLVATGAAYGITLEQIGTIDSLTKKLHVWTRELLNIKTKTPLSTFLTQFDTDIIAPLNQFVAEIPDAHMADAQPVDPILKQMMIDIAHALTTMRTLIGQPNLKTIKDIKNNLSGKIDLAAVLEKAQKELDLIIKHVEAHPDLYTADIHAALKAYKDITLKKFHDELKPKTISEMLSAWLHRFSCK